MKNKRPEFIDDIEKISEAKIIAWISDKSRNESFEQSSHYKMDHTVTELDSRSNIATLDWIVVFANGTQMRFHVIFDITHSILHIIPYKQYPEFNADVNWETRKDDK
jgi:hypothetical protein